MNPASPSSVTKDDLYAAVRGAWTAATSADNAWSATCPSLGQCAVTALVIQDYLGGELMRAEVDGRSHYWNVVDGEMIDLTRDQFAPGAPARNTATRGRSYVLSYADTSRRYDLLRAKTAAILSG
jgi:hypothetical protein